MLYRQLLTYILNLISDLDKEATIVILTRNSHKVCISKKIIKINHIDMYGRICIEQDDIDKAINHIN
jgi:hypothetical protein